LPKARTRRVCGTRRTERSAPPDMNFFWAGGGFSAAASRSFLLESYPILLLLPLTGAAHALVRLAMLTSRRRLGPLPRDQQPGRVFAGVRTPRRRSPAGQCCGNRSTALGECVD